MDIYLPCEWTTKNKNIQLRNSTAIPWKLLIFVFSYSTSEKMTWTWRWSSFAIGCACVIFTYIAHFGTDHIGRLVDLLFFGNIDAVTDAGAAFGTHHFDCFIDSCKTQTKYFVNTNRNNQNLMIDMMMMMLLQDMTGIYYGSIYMV